MIQHFNNLPIELINQPRWVRVNMDKAPLDGSWNNVKNQNYVFEIESPLKGFDISGHDLYPDYLVLDFDHVLSINGEWINDYAKNVYNWIISSVPTYVERSISKTGFHMIYQPTKGLFEALNSNQHNNIYFIDGDTKSKIEFFYKTAGRQFVFTRKLKAPCYVMGIKRVCSCVCYVHTPFIIQKEVKDNAYLRVEVGAHKAFQTTTLQN